MIAHSYKIDKRGKHDKYMLINKQIYKYKLINQSINKKVQVEYLLSEMLVTRSDLDFSIFGFGEYLHIVMRCLEDGTQL
jgi:hypothetical protein